MKLNRLWLSALLIILAGCTTAQRQSATSGAVMGAVGGATAAAVSGLLWGGNDVGEYILKSTVAGAAGGAAAGATGTAMAEHQQKKQAGQPEEVSYDKLRKQIGDINFQAGISWIQCEHKDAIKTAQRAFQSTSNKKQQLYALMIQAAAALECGDKEMAETLYPQMVELDKKRDLDKVKADTLEAMLRVQTVRKDKGMPSCNNP